MPIAAPSAANNEVLQALSATSEYFRATQREVSRSYAGQHCGIIADEMARRLIMDGQETTIEIVYQELREPGAATRVVSFLPEIYRGQMEPWHAHFICCTATHVFDPILGNPEPRETYTQRAFGQEIAIELRFSPQEVRHRVGM